MKWQNKNQICLYCGDIMVLSDRSYEISCWVYTCKCDDFESLQDIKEKIYNLKVKYNEDLEKLENSKPKHKYHFVEELVKI